MRQTAIVKHVGPGGASIEIGGTIIHSALLANTVPAQDLHPGDLVSIQWVDGKPHVVAVLTWHGEYHAVPDEVAPQIVSYEESEPGSTVHGELFGLEEDDHDQYVHVGLSRVITAQHTIAPDSEMAPLALGEFAQGQTVIGLRADQLNKSVLAGNGLVGGGLLTQDATLALNTPGTLGVGSLNLAAGNHTHAIEHASNVQDGATKLLSSNAGLLVLKKLGVSGTPADGYLAKIGGSMELEGNLVFTGATREIQTSTGDLYLAPAGKTQSSKDLTFTGYNRVSEAYVSGAFGAGYAIGHTAAAGSYLEVDNVTVRGSLRTHIFQYDVVRATNGYLYIADATEITHPAEGSYIFVKHPVFHTGDLLWYKDYDLGSSQVVSQVKLTVASENTQVVKNGQTVYRYTVTVNDGSLTDLDAGGTVVRVGGSAQDRQGAVYIDAASQFSPFLDVYAGVASWADFHSPSKVKSRFGRLDGITSGTNEYGLLAGSGIADTDKYLRLSNVMARINNIPVRVFKDGNPVIVLDPDVPYLGVGAVAPSTWLGAPGFWTGLHDGQYKTYVGDNDGSRLQWDGEALGIYDRTNEPILVSGPSGNWMSSLMISESLGQHLFSQADGLALWGPGCELDSTAWVSTRGQKAVISGAFHTGQGAWAGTRGLVVERGTTNYVLNPIFENNVTDGWTLSGTGASRTRDTSVKAVGSASCRLTCAVGQISQLYTDIATAVPNGQTVVAQCLVRKTGDYTADVLLYDKTNPATYVSQSVTKIGDWERIVLTWTNNTGSNANVRLLIRNTSRVVAEELWVDGCQVEIDMPTATSLCYGDRGSGYAWDTPASPHNSTSTRTTTVVSLPDVASLLSSRAVYSIRVVAQMPYAANVTWPFGRFNALWADDLTDVALFYNDDTDTFRLYIEGGARISSPVQTFAAGDVLDIVVTLDYTNDLYHMYINGVLAGSYTSARTSPALTNFYLGCSSTNCAAGIVFSEFAVFGAVLTAEEVAAMYASGKPLTDAGAVTSPGLYILDGQFVMASSSNGARTVMDVDGFSAYNASYKSIWLKTTGDALFGSNVAAPAGTALAVFATDQIYNTEALGAGDVLFGDNSAGKANVLWDASDGLLRFRGGTTTQVYIATDGSLRAGGGAIKISSTANVLFSVASANQGLAWFSDSNFSTLAGYINVATGTGIMTIATGGPSWGTAPDMRFRSSGGGTTWTAIYIDASDKEVRVNGGSGATLSVRNNGDGNWPAFYAQQVSNDRAVAHFDQDHATAPIIRLDGPTAAAEVRSLAGYFRVNVNGSNYWVPYYV